MILARWEDSHLNQTSYTQFTNGLIGCTCPDLYQLGPSSQPHRKASVATLVVRTMSSFHILAISTHWRVSPASSSP